MPGIWIKLLLTYGPAALIVFLVTIVEKKARGFYREARRQNDKTGTIIYVMVWMAIFALAIVIVWVWIDINVPTREATIRGRLIGLDAKEEVKSPFEDLYLRRVYGGKSHFDFVWRIISPKRLAPGTEVDLYLDRSSPEHEDLTVYELPIASDFYEQDTEVTLTYDRESRRLLLRGKNGTTPLKTATTQALLGEAIRKKPGHLLDLARSVYAQQKDNFEILSRRLESDDSVIRVQARSDLAQMGERGLPFVERILGDNYSSYRLRLGAIIALNGMGNLNAGSLTMQANCAIAQAAHSSDPYLREQASKYVSSHPSLKLPNECKGAKGSECEDIRNLKIAVHQIKSLEGINGYMYLAGVSGSDVAELYFVNASAGKFEVDSKIGTRSLRRALTPFAAVTGNVLSPNSYTRKKLGRNQSVDLAFGDKGLKILVLETHSFKDFVVLQTCLGVPSP
jgi:hypothetical protein